MSRSRPWPLCRAPRRGLAIFRDAPLHLGRKWRIRPWTGQAAASPSAQMVWPSISLVTSSSMSISSTVRVALDHALHHPPHPAGAFAARRALAAALMLVELRQPRDRLDDVGRLVHDDDARRCRGRDFTSRSASKSISTRVADRFRDHRHRRAAGDDRQQIVPAAAHAAGMLLDQLLQRDAHRLFDIARLVRHGRRCRRPWCRSFFGRPMPANQAAPRRRMVGATAMRLDIVDRGRAAIEPDRRPGNGGFRRGWPFLPSRLSSSAVSSPQI